MVLSGGRNVGVVGAEGIAVCRLAIPQTCCGSELVYMSSIYEMVCHGEVLSRDRKVGVEGKAMCLLVIPPRCCSSKLVIMLNIYELVYYAVVYARAAVC